MELLIVVLIIGILAAIAITLGHLASGVGLADHVAPERGLLLPVAAPIRSKASSPRQPEYRGDPK